MDTNLLYALTGAPILFAVIALVVVYSRKRRRKNLRQTSIRSQAVRATGRSPDATPAGEGHLLRAAS